MQAQYLETDLIPFLKGLYDRAYEANKFCNPGEYVEVYTDAMMATLRDITAKLMIDARAGLIPMSVIPMPPKVKKSRKKAVPSNILEFKRPCSR